MRKTDKQKLISLVEELGLKREDFSTEELTDKTYSGDPMEIFNITHTQTGLDFLFLHPSNNASRFVVVRRPYTGSRNLAPPQGPFPEDGDDWYSFEQAAESFRRWLVDDLMVARQEEHLPDPWDAASTVTPSFDSDDSAENDEEDPFTDAERADIKVKIGQLKIKIIQNFDPDAEQLRFITKRLKYLEKRVDETPRLDWKGIFVVTMIEIGTALALDPEKTLQLYAAIRGTFSSFRYLLN